MGKSSTILMLAIGLCGSVLSCRLVSRGPQVSNLAVGFHRAPRTSASVDCRVLSPQTVWQLYEYIFGPQQAAAPERAQRSGSGFQLEQVRKCGSYLCLRTEHFSTPSHVALLVTR